MDTRQLTFLGDAYGRVQQARKRAARVSESPEPLERLALAAGAAALLRRLGIYDEHQEWRTILDYLYGVAAEEGITKFEVIDHTTTIHRLQRELDEIGEAVQ